MHCDPLLRAARPFLTLCCAAVCGYGFVAACLLYLARWRSTPRFRYDSLGYHGVVLTGADTVPIELLEDTLRYSGCGRRRVLVQGGHAMSNANKQLFELVDGVVLVNPTMDRGGQLKAPSEPESIALQDYLKLLKEPQTVRLDFIVVAVQFLSYSDAV